MMDIEVKYTLIGLFLLLQCTEILAQQAIPSIGVIATDNVNGWLLYTDRPNIDRNVKIFVLQADNGRRVACCAKILNSVEVPKDGERFFYDAETDKDTKQYVFRVRILNNLISSSNPNAIAVWGISAATPIDSGYVVKTNYQSYEIDSCLATEGFNFYIRSESKDKQLAHYYVSFGYGVDNNDCPAK